MSILVDCWVYQCSNPDCALTGIVNKALLDCTGAEHALCPRCGQTMVPVRKAETEEFDAEGEEALAYYHKYYPYVSLRAVVDFTDDGPVLRWKSPFQDAGEPESPDNHISKRTENGQPTLADLDDNQQVTGKQAAKLLGIGYNLFNQRVRAREIAYIEVDSRGRRYQVGALKAYVESRVVKPRITKPVIPEGSLPVKKETKKRTAAQWRQEFKDL